MSEFVIDQRWINDAELMMGLGTVLSVEHRTVSILFHATGETRTYAKESAPLTRIRFNTGDEITDIHKRKLQVEDVFEEDSLLIYQVKTENGELELLEERDLDTSIQLNKPLERLISGQVDKNKWFDLRYQTWLNLQKNYSSGISGLTGARTSLIPHQLYIANEIASRYAPRVLLADEVGLGKTIEACLILHQQMNRGRANRVLIIVPDALIHQWLVELLRRFNLYFSIFDEERCLAITESTDFENPFHAEQQILCSLDLFTNNPDRFEQVLNSDWDLLIIDEAHHLAWSNEHVSEEYKLVEKLAAITKGLLLLTATPEQFGKESHFARLRLLDPDRFNDYESFVQQENQYQIIADLIEGISNNDQLSDSLLNHLMSLESNVDIELVKNGQLTEQNKSDVIHHLLDCHGTGRVLFRNTRAAIQGFPERQVISYPLTLPEQYKTAIASGSTDLLHPERTKNDSSEWTLFDPRVNWLVELLNKHKTEKILLITHYADTAIELSNALKTQFAIASSVFHENLSIVDRDKRAADFADNETGVQILMCSEIGSEGRNFQFSHHLVLFDLPLNPDLLEQRIGRLDRIGQTQTINIHVPYFEHSAQQRLYNWYDNALNAFNSTCPAGAEIFSKYKEQLIESLSSSQTSDDEYDDFVNLCKQDYIDLNQVMHEGRDRLLEYSSCRKDIANKIQSKIENFEQNSQLKLYMNDLFDCYGVNIEEHKSGSYIISPAEHMVGQFPGLHDDGMTVTFDRNVALSHDDMHFLSWDHPMVLNGIDMLLGNEMGNTSVCSIKSNDFQPGQLLIQTVHVLNIEIPHEHQQEITSEQLQALPVLSTYTESCEDISPEFKTYKFKSVAKAIAKQIVQLKESDIKNILSRISDDISTHASEYLQSHYSTNLLILENEIDRLTALKAVNPQVRDEEIEFFKSQLNGFRAALDNPVNRLDSIRLIITT
ncbi:MAG: RNA polymerase-associated protein RapA [endosymbiont of Galathealinum brachiosum]|uniref:RNA polymerase-associated protein RapA n=1 Tax=endosymbiont of Galathealinum brachiosum TaxID=2200906 RepID=A0A370DHW1_9GAMM|nr:MAG: RNA polymerase-associated protein RapA [endosymbiont of Galathealinum brachiosum]